MRVFVDASVLIHWLNKTNDYENIEKIRKYADSCILERLITSPEVELEICKGKNGFDDWSRINREWKLKKCIGVNTPLSGIEAAVKDVTGIVNRAKEKYNKLFKVTKNQKDTLHYSTAENIEEADYFLVVDKDFCREMSIEAAHLPQSTKIVNPKELVSIILKKEHNE